LQKAPSLQGHGQGFSWGWDSRNSFFCPLREAATKRVSKKFISIFWGGAPENFEHLIKIGFKE
jgi:hypothetical protein